MAGKDAVVAYNPESADNIYLLRDGDFLEFHLIESRFLGKSFEEIRATQLAQRDIVDSAVRSNLQGRVDLTSHIEKIVGNAGKGEDVNIKGVREARKQARKERHRDFMEEVENNEQSFGTDAKDDDGKRA